MPCKSAEIKWKRRVGWWVVLLGRTIAVESRDLRSIRLPYSSSINRSCKKKRVRFCHRQQPSVLIFFLKQPRPTRTPVRRSYYSKLLLSYQFIVKVFSNPCYTELVDIFSVQTISSNFLNVLLFFEKNLQ